MYKLGSVTLIAEDGKVRVTVANIGGVDAPPRTAVTKQRPSAEDVAQLITDIRGYRPDNAVLQACGRVAADARTQQKAKEIP